MKFFGFTVALADGACALSFQQRRRGTMGLDAHVCCDCFERNRLHSAPPPGCNLSVRSDGSLLCGSDGLKVQIDFDVWQYSQACDHKGGYLVAKYLGNIALVAFLREELGRSRERFPIILSRVVHNGTHSGDYIAAAEVSQLATEIEALIDVHCPDPENEKLVREFEIQMQDLVSAAVRVGKPIVF